MPESKYKMTYEVKGRIVGVRQIQDRGRIQIPKIIKEKLQVKDGDNMYWIELEDKFYLTKAVKIT